MQGSQVSVSIHGWPFHTIPYPNALGNNGFDHPDPNQSQAILSPSSIHLVPTPSKQHNFPLSISGSTPKCKQTSWPPNQQKFRIKPKNINDQTQEGTKLTGNNPFRPFPRKPSQARQPADFDFSQVLLSCIGLTS